MTPPVPQHLLEEDTLPAESLLALWELWPPPGCPSHFVSPVPCWGSTHCGSLPLAGTRGHLGAPKPRNKVPCHCFIHKNCPPKKMNSIKEMHTQNRKPQCVLFSLPFPCLPVPQLLGVSPLPGTSLRPQQLFLKQDYVVSSSTMFASSPNGIFPRKTETTGNPPNPLYPCHWVSPHSSGSRVSLGLATQTPCGVGGTSQAAGGAKPSR